MHECLKKRPALWTQKCRQLYSPLRPYKEQLDELTNKVIGVAYQAKEKQGDGEVKDNLELVISLARNFKTDQSRPDIDRYKRRF